MKDRKTELSAFVLRLSDFFILNLSFLIGILLTYIIKSTLPKLSLLDILVYNILWLFFSSIFKLYSFSTLRNTVIILRQTFKVVLSHFVLFAFYFLFVYYFYSEKRMWFLIGNIASLLIFVTISRIYLTYLMEFVADKANLNRNCAIIGKNSLGNSLQHFFGENEHLYTFKRFLDDDLNSMVNANASQVSGASILEFVNTLQLQGIDEVYSTVPITPLMSKIYTAAENNCIKLHFVSKSELSGSSLSVRHIDNISSSDFKVYSLRNEPLNSLRNRIKKRAFDFAFSSFVILFILSWLYPIIGLIIKLSSPGPILFKQERSGKDNKPFYCYKFRSMKVNKDSDSMQATKNDSRLTKFGAFMRKTSLDELPQFFNVWKGEMSIVGPRPHMLKHTDQYKTLIDKYLVRQFLKPGITGWAQVNGFRGETKELILMEKRVEHDIWYMENWSLMLDVRIVFMTVINVAKGEPEAY
ncbi:exopolysaccharide biosynthesis polyprenyl glycosylphosphotransferase [Rhizosphaericola mali]|uniref:Exopolysaccharide biosynthesis polyprenyl glycosylphosphotransferase n=1 Tax=Rhizosphaericola mali TaxID=2545455 RepID=A0A5P2G2C8_9BACT|nr:exopolysaccharide biosynthesis polyprenyl glycosylphosphotransferase [Rhizosphaericola mali]QES87980.1 exopolysaccharide biosynthesis polyprenyl glycosylphosphotransferase [Rhizosphaericola mali]